MASSQRQSPKCYCEHSTLVYIGSSGGAHLGKHGSDKGTDPILQCNITKPCYSCGSPYDWRNPAGWDGQRAMHPGIGADNVNQNHLLITARRDTMGGILIQVSSVILTSREVCLRRFNLSLLLV